MWIVPDAKIVMFNVVVVISVTVVVLRSGFIAQALPLSLSVLILFGNIKQLTKLHMSIFFPTS